MMGMQGLTVLRAEGVDVRRLVVAGEGRLSQREKRERAGGPATKPVAKPSESGEGRCGTRHVPVQICEPLTKRKPMAQGAAPP